MRMKRLQKTTTKAMLQWSKRRKTKQKQMLKRTGKKKKQRLIVITGKVRSKLQFYAFYLFRMSLMCIRWHLIWNPFVILPSLRVFENINTLRKTPRDRVRKNSQEIISARNWLRRAFYLIIIFRLKNFYVSFKLSIFPPDFLKWSLLLFGSFFSIPFLSVLLLRLSRRYWESYLLEWIENARFEVFVQGKKHTIL